MFPFLVRSLNSLPPTCKYMNLSSWRGFVIFQPWCGLQAHLHRLPEDSGGGWANLGPSPGGLPPLTWLRYNHLKVFHHSPDWGVITWGSPTIHLTKGKSPGGLPPLTWLSYNHLKVFHHSPNSVRCNLLRISHHSPDKWKSFLTKQYRLFSNYSASNNSIMCKIWSDWHKD